MEILIAILWYLQLLVPGTAYTHSDIGNLIQQNNKEINAVKNDKQFKTQVMSDFNSTGNSQWKRLIEEWTDPPPQPILD
ncbi:MAG: hypothetical protein EPN82_16725 [Bacteroidetes bacterium]|nr:MAG: hypothetical protein EPN82_16725 [Bacteroidota bacterium]